MTNMTKDVSTHSRPKAAGILNYVADNYFSFNTQPPEGGCHDYILLPDVFAVSTHSRPKAAGVLICLSVSQFAVSTHSRPKAAGLSKIPIRQDLKFQHTAARRRLMKRPEAE